MRSNKTWFNLIHTKKYIYKNNMTIKREKVNRI